jgi:ABC-2 type transport system permease protein
MDNRRQTAVYRKKQNDDSNFAFLFMLVIYTLFSGFIALGIVASPFMLGVPLFFSYLMVMMAVTLVTDFSSILLDTSDNTIILPRPVDSKTLYVARVTHILIYLGQLAISLSILPCIALIYKYGLILLLPTLLAIILAVSIAVLLTNALYLLIMRFANEQKVKTIINYFQIIMAIVLMGGYQILPRLLGRFDYENYVFEIHWWSYLFPPIWISGSMETLLNLQLDTPHLVFILLSIATPLIAIYATNRWLTPFYNRKLLSINATGSERNERSVEKKDSSKSIFNINKIASWVTSSNYEKGSFSFVYKMLGRDHKLKLKIYPSFGFMIVLSFLFIFNSKKDLATVWAELPTTYLNLVLLYLPVMVVQVALREVTYSDDFKASWIYLSAPLQKPGELLLGKVKAVFIKLIVPIYVLISIIILFIWGVSSIDDILIGLINNALITMVIASIGDKYLPLSVPSTAKTESGNLARGILTMFCMAIPGLIHYWLNTFTWPLIILVPFQFLLIYWLVKQYRNTSWTQIKI